MFFGFDLKEIFMFPVKDAEARRHFLIGCVVSLAGFVIPILPYFVLSGYAVKIVKQIFNNESPHMVAWDDWGGMFKDGAKMYGVRIVYSIPILLLLIPFIIGSIGLPILIENVNSAEVDTVITVYTLIMFGALCLFIPLSFPLAVIIPAAEMHAVDRNEFAAGFRIKELWPILRANLSGFIAAFGIFYAASIVLTLALQIIMVTLILACLLPVLMPALIMYLTLIMYAALAQAYKIGKDKLSEKEAILQQA